MASFKSFIRWFSVVMIFTVSVKAQVTPTPFAAFLGSGSPVKWSPWTSGAAFGALPATPPAIALYCQVSAGAPWTPCDPSGGSGGGSVTTVSVATANGFQGTVANPTTTPAITISTDGTHVLPTNTGSSSTYLNGAGAYTTPPGLTNVMTTEGDMISASSGGVPVRVPGPTVDGVNYFEGSPSVEPTWVPAGSVSVGFAFNISAGAANEIPYANPGEPIINWLAAPTATGTYYLCESPTGSSAPPLWCPAGSVTPAGANAVQGSNAGGTALAATNPTTSLNALPVFEYTNVPRQPLAAWFQANHNCAYQVCSVNIIGDSFSVIDVTNGGTGPTISTNRWTEQLRINGQAFNGSHGTGVVPLMMGYTAPGTLVLNNEAWSCTGTFDFTTGAALGPVQTGTGTLMQGIVHMGNGAICTFTDSRGILWDTFHLYYETSSGTGSIALLATDTSTSLGTANSSTASATGAVSGGFTASRFDATTGLPTGSHTVTLTSTGDTYVYAASGSNGTTGFEVNLMGMGAARADMFGNSPATQLAFADLIPGGAQLATVGFLTNDVVQGVTNVSQYASYLTGIINHETALGISVLQEIPPVDSAISGNANTPIFTAAAQGLCATLPISCTNIQDQWGTTYNAGSGLWVTGTFAGTHPNDKGSQAEYALIYGASLDPAPYNLPTGVISRNGFSIAQLGGQFQGFVENGTTCVFCDLYDSALVHQYDFGQGQGAAQLTFIANSLPSLGLINSVGLYLRGSVSSTYDNSDFYFTQAGLGMTSGSQLCWTNSSTNAGTANTALSVLCDTSLSRNSSGVIQMSNLNTPGMAQAESTVFGEAPNLANTTGSALNTGTSFTDNNNAAFAFFQVAPSSTSNNAWMGISKAAGVQGICSTGTGTITLGIIGGVTCPVTANMVYFGAAQLASINYSTGAASLASLNVSGLVSTPYLATDSTGKLIAAATPSSGISGLTITIGGSLIAVGCSNQTPVTITGVTTTMSCIMSGATTSPSNIQPQCFVSAANTVTPQLCTAIAVGTTPGSQSYNIRVIP